MHFLNGLGGSRYLFLLGTLSLSLGLGLLLGLALLEERLGNEDLVLRGDGAASHVSTRTYKQTSRQGKGAYVPTALDIGCRWVQSWKLAWAECRWILDQIKSAALGLESSHIQPSPQFSAIT